jgi:hypothetical protein
MFVLEPAGTRDVPPGGRAEPPKARPSGHDYAIATHHPNTGFTLFIDSRNARVVVIDDHEACQGRT